MPLKLTDLQKTKQAVTLDYEGESVTVYYRPAVLTALLRLRLYAGPRVYYEGADIKAAAALDLIPAVEAYHAELARLLVSWDVVDEQGKPVPVTTETLAELPDSFLNAVIRAVADSGVADPPSGEDSPAISPPTD